MTNTEKELDALAEQLKNDLPTYKRAVAGMNADKSRAHEVAEANLTTAVAMLDRVTKERDKALEMVNHVIQKARGANRKYQSGVRAIRDKDRNLNRALEMMKVAADRDDFQAVVDAAGTVLKMWGNQ